MPESDFHAHVYFGPLSREAALALRPRLLELAVPGLSLGKINEGPRGPHTIPSYEVYVPCSALPLLLKFFDDQRGELSILIHPLSEDEVRDHSTSALWLGAAVPLDYSALQKK